MRYELLAPPRARRRAKPQVGVILRYRDAHLYLLDPEHKRYDSVSLAAAVSSYRKELAASRRGQPSERLPVRPGTRRTRGQAPLKRPRAHLRWLGLTRTIGGLSARAFLLRQGHVRERLWYSPALPQPPRRVRRLMARAMSGAGAGPFAPAQRGEAGRVPVEIDVRRGKGWRRVLRTTRVRRAPPAAVACVLPAGTASEPPQPPDGEDRQRARPSDPLRADRRGPRRMHSGLSRSGPRGADQRAPRHLGLLLGHALRGSPGLRELDQPRAPGHGGRRVRPAGLQGLLGPLSQYGVGKGRFLGYSLVRDNPPTAWARGTSSPSRSSCCSSASDQTRPTTGGGGATTTRSWRSSSTRIRSTAVVGPATTSSHPPRASSCSWSPTRTCPGSSSRCRTRQSSRTGATPRSTARPSTRPASGPPTSSWRPPPTPIPSPPGPTR